MTAALEGGEWSEARPGRTLPPGKTRYPLYRRLVGAPGPVWTGGKSRPHRDNNVIHVSINKQLIISQNCFCVLSRLCQGKGSKTFSHFSAGNATLCCGQHVARELRFERSCAKRITTTFYNVITTICPPIQVSFTI